jgi:hypothetical protein
VPEPGEGALRGKGCAGGKGGHVDPRRRATVVENVRLSIGFEM